MNNKPMKETHIPTVIGTMRRSNKQTPDEGLLKEEIVEILKEWGASPLAHPMFEVADQILAKAKPVWEKQERERVLDSLHLLTDGQIKHIQKKGGFNPQACETCAEIDQTLKGEE